MGNRRRRTEFATELDNIQGQLADLSDRIDDLGNLGDEIIGSSYPDEYACYASNSLQGTLALLREMGRLVLGSGSAKKKGRRR